MNCYPISTLTFLPLEKGLYYLKPKLQIAALRRHTFAVPKCLSLSFQISAVLKRLCILPEEESRDSALSQPCLLQLPGPFELPHHPMGAIVELLLSVPSVPLLLSLSVASVTSSLMNSSVVLVLLDVASPTLPDDVIEELLAGPSPSHCRLK